MRRTLLLIPILLLSAGLALAQYSGSSSSNDKTSSSNNATQSSSAAHKTSLEGCLSKAKRIFTLTDQSGTAYKLEGKTASLRSHVGQTIRVSGEEIGIGANPGAMSSTQAQSKPVFKVRTFRRVSSTCKSPM
jgi:hypothetical protein